MRSVAPTRTTALPDRGNDRTTQEPRAAARMPSTRSGRGIRMPACASWDVSAGLCDDAGPAVSCDIPSTTASLFMFNDLSDAELAYCYQHAKALIFPSHAEGFGLPIVEALQHGLHTLVSDIPIHREAGRDFCTYFDPQSPAALARLVCDVEATGRFPRCATSRTITPCRVGPRARGSFLASAWSPVHAWPTARPTTSRKAAVRRHQRTRHHRG